MEAGSRAGTLTEREHYGREWTGFIEDINNYHLVF